jgi:hypothetical protein
VVIKQEGESTQTYLKRFNKEMLKMKELLKPIALEALIRGVRKHAPWRRFYTLPYVSLLKVKQFIKNYIQVE